MFFLVKNSKIAKQVQNSKVSTPHISVTLLCFFENITCLFLIVLYYQLSFSVYYQLLLSLYLHHLLFCIMYVTVKLRNMLWAVILFMFIAIYVIVIIFIIIFIIIIIIIIIIVTIIIIILIVFIIIIINTLILFIHK